MRSSLREMEGPLQRSRLEGLRMKTGMVERLDGQVISSRILTIRGVQVILDWDIAELYGVETRVLNQAVKRNAARFPERFRFLLSKSELSELITSCDKFGNKKHYPGTPAAYTEQGAAMLSAVLRSQTAVDVSIRIMDAFVAMRNFIVTNAAVLQRLGAVEMKQIAMDEKLNNVLGKIESKEFLLTQTELNGVSELKRRTFNWNMDCDVIAPRDYDHFDRDISVIRELNDSGDA